MNKMDCFLIFVLLLTLLCPCFGIDCYVCKSDEAPKRCTSFPASVPPETAIPAANCSDVYKLINGWITNHDFMKYSIGDLNLEKVVNFIGDETTHLSDLKEVTACALFTVSSENVVTAEFDKTVAKARSFFGDEKAAEPVTVREWVMRDCVTLKLRQETKDATADRCFTISGTEKVAKMHFCTCTTDKCNLPSEQVQGFIKDEEATTKANGGIDFSSQPIFLKLAFAGIIWGIVYQKSQNC